MKFSVIVPVYNVEKYIKDCIDSILNQSYDNFELIIVNDGSTDKSKDILEKYTDKRIKLISKDNTGVADTRNYGISQCTGDYFIFVDSDDTIHKDLLKELNKILEKDKLDLVKYQIQMIYPDRTKYDKPETFKHLDGEEAFSILLKNDLFVTPVTYAYRLEYWKKNNYKYLEGRVHEDFGLTPIVVVNADSVTCIDLIGYNYYVRENSIMTSSKEKIVSRNKDSFDQYDRLMKMIDDIKVSSETRKLFKSYISNGMINRTKEMDGSVLKDYIKELKKRNIYKYLIDDTIVRKVKKQVFRLVPNLYVRLIVK